jgi:tetratricopeptide (TPR) repeat protein
MEEADAPISRKRGNALSSRWLLAGLAVVTILGLLGLMVLVPVGVRALPGRYAARLPGFLQDLRYRPHSDILPTPAVVVTPLLAPSATPTAARLRGVTFVTGTPERGPNGAGDQAEGPPIALVTLKPTRSLAETPGQPATSIAQTPSPTVSVPPMPTASATPTSTPPPPTPTVVQLPVRASLPPITHTYQTWNNCGPATVNMALFYFGQFGSQADAAAFLKPDPEDKNVSAYEMETYVRALGLKAVVRVGGDLPRLKRLIASGFPVVVETWFIPEPGDQMGHYRVLVGYDDDARQFIAQDSYNGPNVRLDYDAFDELWRVFNRIYLVIYHPDQYGELAAILDSDVDDGAMYERALVTAQTEALNPSAECVAYETCADAAAFAWFNVGSSMVSLGRHQEAAAAYDQARVLGLPWRMLWYQFGPYEAYYAVDRFDDVITLATATLNVVANLEESHFWRGVAYLANGEVERARSDFQAAINYNPHFTPAMEVLESLE